MKRFVLLVLASVFSASAFADACFDNKDLQSCIKKCNQNDGYACFLSGYLHSTSNAFEKSAMEYEKACKLKFDFGCTALAMIASQDAINNNFDRAKTNFEKACDLKVPMGCSGLAILYDQGEGVKQNKVMAKEYFGKACDMGEQSACDDYRKLNEQGY